MTTIRKIVVPILGLFLLTTVTACGDKPVEAQAVKVKVEGIRDATQLGDILFGGQPSEESLKRLHDEGYRTILTTRPKSEMKWDEKAQVEALGMQFVSIPMSKPVKTITEDQIEAFDKAMKNAPRPMLLHCGSGNRVSGLYAVWLAKRKGMSAEEAFRMGEKAGMTAIQPVVKEMLGLGKDD